MCDESTAMLTLLRDHWSDWKLSEDGSLAVFAAGAPALLEEFNRHASALKLAADEQGAVMAKMNSKGK